MGELEAVKSLIESGCNKEARDSRGCTTLYVALYNSKLGVAKYLISIGADKEAVDCDSNVKQYLISIGAK
ncbi:dysferlin-interacting protein, putative [Trichomonas vaginalis G3]|uniref:Dysferlin-interacting protein, putative n=1 Tax=Trichomonas vaginalis (strain ATCC PRA-98 / G3) TaxID=412133 RepID=A2E727_TRIV3|nr:ankyrin repeat protein family [Trichomonas vaginalis G3]EAY11545.1 dysferlin-interacting protein, putative [Trichomonas vaginalis G3]KAI5489429.1 ankyrin repeat protein family [Trichomonas vaginalis G3]|eukprot:XP_001323768.1 dysferlin-interacting protein [Trichomonas vaginalis G3]